LLESLQKSNKTIRVTRTSHNIICATSKVRLAVSLFNTIEAASMAELSRPLQRSNRITRIKNQIGLLKRETKTPVYSILLSQLQWLKQRTNSITGINDQIGLLERETNTPDYSILLSQLQWLKSCHDVHDRQFITDRQHQRPLK